jgi:hypothetical protein
MKNIRPSLPRLAVKEDLGNSCSQKSLPSLLTGQGSDRSLRPLRKDHNHVLKPQSLITVATIIITIDICHRHRAAHLPSHTHPLTSSPFEITQETSTAIYTHVISLTTSFTPRTQPMLRPRGTTRLPRLSLSLSWKRRQRRIIRGPDRGLEAVQAKAAVTTKDSQTTGKPVSDGFDCLTRHKRGSVSGHAS